MSRPRFLADHDLNEHIVVGVLRQEPAVEFVRIREIGMGETYQRGDRQAVAPHDRKVIKN